MRWVDTAALAIRTRAVPLFVGFAITHRCNQSCRYCAVYEDPAPEMDLPTTLRVLDDLHRHGMRFISITGGEPLLSDRLPAVVDLLVRRGVSVNVNTNGTLVHRHLDLLARVASVTVSLDGPQAVHDRARGNFARTVEGIRALVERGADVTLRAVLSAHNVDADGLEPVVALASELRVTCVFQPARRLRLGSTQPDPDLPGPEAMRSAVRRLAALRAAGAPVGNSGASLRHFETWPEGRDIGCVGGRISFRLEPDGRFTGCELPPGVAWVDLPRTGVGAALRDLPRPGCRTCWCSGLVEMALARRLDPGAVAWILGRLWPRRG